MCATVDDDLSIQEAAQSTRAEGRPFRPKVLRRKPSGSSGERPRKRRGNAAASTMPKPITAMLTGSGGDKDGLFRPILNRPGFVGGSNF